MMSPKNTQMSSSSKFKNEADVVKKQFLRVAKRHFIMMYISLLLMVVLAVSLLVSFVLIMDSIISAYIMMILLIVIFCFLVLRIWIITQYPHLITSLRDQLLDMRAIINYQEGVVQHHYWIAQKMCRFVEDIQLKSNVSIYSRLFSFLPLRNSYEQWLSERINEFFEVIVLAAGNEYIKLIRYEPLNKDVHWQLADTYLHIARMYQKRKDVVRSGMYMLLFQEDEAKIIESLHKYAEKALQEYHIIKRFGEPNKELHIQCASVYRMLNDSLNECKELENTVSIDPKNLAQWFKLGILYFQTGQTSRGLEVYKKLKNERYTNADKMMIFYASYTHGS